MYISLKPNSNSMNLPSGNILKKLIYWSVVHNGNSKMTKTSVNKEKAKNKLSHINMKRIIALYFLIQKATVHVIMETRKLLRNRFHKMPLKIKEDRKLLTVATFGEVFTFKLHLLECFKIFY